MKYAIVTFGCRVNQADSLRIEEELRARGGDDAPSPTPTWWSSTPARSPPAPIRAPARRSGASPATIPRARIVVTGCYATRRPEEVARAAERRARRPATTTKTDWSTTVAMPDLDRRAVRRRRRGVRRGHRARRRRPHGVHAARADRLRGACSYCIIPTTRGAGRSRADRRRRARGRARRGRGLQGDRAHRRAPGIVRPRPEAARLARSTCCARSMARRPT